MLMNILVFSDYFQLVDRKTSEVYPLCTDPVLNFVNSNKIDQECI